MRMVRIEAVRDGMTLARDIPGPTLGSLPLMRNGAALTASIAKRLEARSIRAIWVEDTLGEGIECAASLPDSVRVATERASNACMNAARDVFAAGGGHLPQKTLTDIEQAAAGILHTLLNCPDAALAFDDLAGADSYTYTHSIRVATLGMMLGHRMMNQSGWTDYTGKRRFDRIEERLSDLGFGLLVHDIGKISIPADVLNKPGKLDDEEWELMKTHPDAGVSLLPANLISPLSVAVVRDHHERWDGKGYSRGKAGDSVHLFGRIAAIADVYDAVTAARPYKEALPPHVGVQVIRDGAGTQFDPKAVQCFLGLVMPYPVGYEVQLAEGVSGVVKDVDPQQPEHPTVRYLDERGDVRENVMHIHDGVVLEGYDGVRAPAKVHELDVNQRASLAVAA